MTYMSGMQPFVTDFKMPFLPRKTAKESRIKSRAPSKSVYNPHVCATCGGANAALNTWDDPKGVDVINKIGK